ncbi:hypothetical protein [Nocardioides mangrovi]|uniref:CHAP domain-containing protein n=1 Tax=Nocardioides mangrovi TaxID=2874580 RepID=A0ABS7UI52_9ACTN|nr:hypothetical protein [Nocardioides mangrovi]MBZ5740480.1 hypothetical protein [Nocardioides mangrovi]
MPLSRPVTRLAHAPTWVLSTLAVVAVTSTGVVAGVRHADPTPDAPDAPEAAQATQAAVAPVTASVTPPAERVVDAVRLVRKPVEPSIPVATSDAAETVAAAEASSYNVPGQCLGWTREQADIPSRYDDAATAWEHASDRHPGDTSPPKGAAVYWLGGSSGHGHVAISLGDGRVRSSDAGGYGVVGTIQLERLTREWGLQYAGWSDSINGYRIPGVANA